ncbi:MAG: UTP--glucose-1-phosphate uridylyltransferase, partial [Nannocystaceae bacterium]
GDDPRILGLAGLDARAHEALAERGAAALREGKVAALILNGGLATRFGRVVKGVVPVLDERPELSFLAVRLGQLRRLTEALDRAIPVVVMHSFATRGESEAHLEAIAWGGIAAPERLTFTQSILPRLRVDGMPLIAAPGAEGLADVDLFAAPGHGDTLRRAAETGLCADLRARGVEHVLVANVDNLGATLDPRILGLHLGAVDAGAQVSVEVVRREDGDVGGCIAEVEGKAVIVEGIRLPEGDDPGRYPHFNTNTLWLTLDALASRPPLDFFPVHRQVVTPSGEAIEVVQFEQLIGQITEHVPARYLEVPREDRFLPIKTREDLLAARARMEALVAELAG